MESSASEGEDNVEVMEIDEDDGHSDHSDEEPDMKEEDLQGQKDNSASDDEKNVSVVSLRDYFLFDYLVSGRVVA